MMDSRILFFILIIIAVSLEIGADIIFKKWAIENQTMLFAVGMIVYLIGTAFWAYSLKFEMLSEITLKLIPP